jgi:hypothetical protein
MTTTNAHSAGNSSKIYFPQRPDQKLDLAPGGTTEMSGLSGVLAFSDMGFVRNAEYQPIAQTDKPGLLKFIEKCNDQLFALNNSIRSMSTAMVQCDKSELRNDDVDGVLFLVTGLSELINELLNALGRAQECLENNWFLESPDTEI